ncbi:hypothetical protein [Sorangium cellulosum]|uniref:hypothetical protein n=1 Tax=Sorangium cellulosum TaxID=56 RepID=UPI001F1BA4CF|nr:hypothetical protein [Sorangium cellulosum]
MFLIWTLNDSCWASAPVSLAAYCSSSAGVVAPPVVELAVVELVALPPPTPVVALVVLLAVVLTELLAVALVVLLVLVLLAVVLTELLAVVLVTSAPPSPPAPPMPPAPPSPPAELLTVVLATPPPEPDVPLVAEPVVLLEADAEEPTLLELVTPIEVEVGLPPPPPPSPPRLEPSAHAASISREAAERALESFDQERDSPTRWLQLPGRSGAPALVDLFIGKPRLRAASDVFGPSSDAHLAIGRILSTPASAQPCPKVERKEVELWSLTRSPGLQQEVWAQGQGYPGTFLLMS